MLGTTNRIPEALTDDATDVTEALEVARALWERDERKDAIRWVRRAAEAAEEAGQTMRLATLARAAAELEDAAPPPSLARRSMPPSPPRSLSTPPQSISTPPSRSVIPASPRSVPPPPPRSVAPPASVAPPPSRVTSAPPLPSNRPSKPTSLPVPHQPSSSVQLVRKAQDPEPTRVRVSVRLSARDGSLFVVRPLAEGQAAPPGTREAFLVMTEVAGADVSLANGSEG